MVHAVVGEEAFVKGLRAYMKEFAYGNATTNDLWAAWQKSSGKNIPELMDAWTKQTGFPVVELQKVNGDGSLVLEQRRFFADGAAVAGLQLVAFNVYVDQTTTESDRQRELARKHPWARLSVKPSPAAFGQGHSLNLALAALRASGATQHDPNP